MVAALYLVFIYAPTDVAMGIVQRIFYLMVPLGWLSLLSFLIVFISSILYLKNRESRWDICGHSSAEVGIIFTTLALIVGSIWAKPVWGVWWTWEAKLTTTLVLWLIYLAYLMVRSFATEESRGARFAAVVGIVGFIDVPLVAMANVLWRGMHPSAIVFEGGLTPSMLFTLLVCLAAFTALYIHLLVQRISLREAEVEIGKLKQT